MCFSYKPPNTVYNFAQQTCCSSAHSSNKLKVKARVTVMSRFSPPPPPNSTQLPPGLQEEVTEHCVWMDARNVAAKDPLRSTWAGVTGWYTPAVCLASVWRSRSCVRRGWLPGRCCESHQWTWTHACPCTGLAGRCCSRSAIIGTWGFFSLSTDPLSFLHITQSHSIKAFKMILKRIENDPQTCLALGVILTQKVALQLWKWSSPGM